MNINWHNYKFTWVLALVPQTLLTRYVIVNIIVVCTFLNFFIYLPLPIFMNKSTYIIIHCIKLKGTVYRMLQTVKLSKFEKNKPYHQCDMSRYFRFYNKLYYYKLPFFPFNIIRFNPLTFCVLYLRLALFMYM